jgi:hypothetical protein
MPAYVAYQLIHCATRVVQAPTAMFDGIRREGGLKDGLAFIGKPHRAFDNAGNRLPAPAGMVFAVYADAEHYVFDWDWVAEDSSARGHPSDWQSRFGSIRPTTTPAVLVELDGLTPGRLDPSVASYSAHGDCVFCYFSYEVAYADRINEDLTIFRKIEGSKAVGFKIKNIERITRTLVWAAVVSPAFLESHDFHVGIFLAQSYARQAGPRSYVELFQHLGTDTPRVDLSPRAAGGGTAA